MGVDRTGARAHLHVLVVAAATTALFGVAAIVLPQGTTAPNRPVVAAPVLVAPEPAPAEAPAQPVTTVPDDVTGPMEISAPPVPVTAPPPAPVPSKVVKALFLGDSVASTTANGLRASGPQHGVQVVNAGIWGCGVVRGVPFRYFGKQYDALPNDCDHWDSQWRASIDREQPQVAVLMVGRWELMDRVHGGRWTSIGDPAFDAYLVSEMQTAIAVAASRGAKVALCTTPYYRRGDAPGGQMWPEDQPGRVDQVNALLRQAAAGAPGVATVIDLGAHLSPEGRLAMNIDGVRVRTDGVHVAPEAGPWLAPWLLPQLAALGSA